LCAHYTRQSSDISRKNQWHPQCSFKSAIRSAVNHTRPCRFASPCGCFLQRCGKCHLKGRGPMAIKATFIPGSGLLSVLGDSLDALITVSRNAAGMILINGGAVPVLGGPATVANTTLIQVFGQAGNDTITVDESNGALPAAQLFGGNGNDTMTGGSGNDLL